MPRFFFGRIVLKLANKEVKTPYISLLTMLMTKILSLYQRVILSQYMRTLQWYGCFCNSNTVLFDGQLGLYNSDSTG